jgi:hypothetical protein
MIAVRFLRSHPPYNAGEIAGVPAGHVERLVKAGIIERPKAADPAPEPTAPAAEMRAVEAAPVDRMISPGPGRRGPVRK